MPDILDLQEWDECLGKMIRYHCNISMEIKELIVQIRKEMKEELVPTAEDRANYGKVVKQGIRSMWSLEYEIDDIQKEFAKSIGNIDIDNLTDDFVEDVMIQSKPLQGILHAIRKRQKAQMETIKKEYWEKVKDLEPLRVPRPPKPVPKPPEEKKPEGEKKEGEGEKKEGEAAPAAEGDKPKEGDAAAAAPPAEPAPAVAAEQPAAVQAAA